MKTNLELIVGTDRFPYANDKFGALQHLRDRLYSLIWEDDLGQYAIGYVPNRVVEELNKVPVSVRGKINVSEKDRTIILFKEQSLEEGRSCMVAALTNYWRDMESFKLLKGWRNELWPIYDRKGDLLFKMERAAVGLLGTMRYGVHMVAYIDDPVTPFGIKVWVPRRASDKSTFPGMLDNTVAGGLMAGEDPFECVIREAGEEATLPDHVVRDNAQSVGTVTYIYITEAKYFGEDGYIYPECQWVYDLKLPASVKPQPKDGEVKEFRLCDVDTLRGDLRDEKFRPNSALIMIDFFIRHGILSEANEPNLAAIQRRMHREMPFPGPHQAGWPRP